MNSILKHNTFFIKEYTGIWKAANSYDILNPETNELLMECREPNLGFFTKMFRFSKYKRSTPFNVEINDNLGKRVCRIKRGVSLWRSSVEVYDENDTLIGKFRQRLLTLGGKFDLNDPNGQLLFTLEGKWSNFDYTFKRGEEKLGMITKKWMGIGKELFTSADNYIVNIEPIIASNDTNRILILASAICIDMVYYE
jgi:uncharacterized protein YxjI